MDRERRDPFFSLFGSSSQKVGEQDALRLKLLRIEFGVCRSAPCADRVRRRKREAFDVRVRVPCVDKTAAGGVSSP
jgi:hypothetical protein